MGRTAAKENLPPAAKERLPDKAVTKKKTAAMKNSKTRKEKRKDEKSTSEAKVKLAEKLSSKSEDETCGDEDPVKLGGEGVTKGASGVGSDPAAAEEYRCAVHGHLRRLERRPELLVASDYLAGQREVLPGMRGMLVDWMGGVVVQLALLPETLHLAVSCLDRFLQAEFATLAKEQLQLVAAAALLLAAKYEESMPPELAELAHTAGGGAPEAELRRMELRMLRRLDFRLGVPAALQFLRWARLADPALLCAQAHQLAKYLLELSLVDYRLVSVLPSRRAAAAAALAARLLGTGSVRGVWRRRLEGATGYTVEGLVEVMQQLAVLVGRAATNKSLLTVFRKFSGERSLKVARMAVLASPLVAALAAGRDI